MDNFIIVIWHVPSDICSHLYGFMCAPVGTVDNKQTDSKMGSKLASDVHIWQQPAGEEDSSHSFEVHA